MIAFAVLSRTGLGINENGGGGSTLTMRVLLPTTFLLFGVSIWVSDVVTWNSKHLLMTSLTKSDPVTLHLLLDISTAKGQDKDDEVTPPIHVTLPVVGVTVTLQNTMGCSTVVKNCMAPTSSWKSETLPHGNLASFESNGSGRRTYWSMGSCM